VKNLASALVDLLSAIFTAFIIYLGPTTLQETGNCYVRIILKVVLPLNSLDNVSSVCL